MSAFRKTFWLLLFLSVLVSGCKMDTDSILGNKGQVLALGWDVCSHRKVVQVRAQKPSKPECSPPPQYLEDVLVFWETDLMREELTLDFSTNLDGHYPQVEKIMYRPMRSTYESSTSLHDAASHKALECNKPEIKEDRAIYKCFLPSRRRFGGSSFKEHYFHSITIVDKECRSRAEYEAVFYDQRCADPKYWDDPDMYQGPYDQVKVWLQRYRKEMSLLNYKGIEIE